MIIMNSRKASFNPRKTYFLISNQKIFYFSSPKKENRKETKKKPIKLRSFGKKLIKTHLITEWIVVLDFSTW
jgi:hypothetical protein